LLLRTIGGGAGIRKAEAGAQAALGA